MIFGILKYIKDLIRFILFKYFQNLITFEECPAVTIQLYYFQLITKNNSFNVVLPKRSRRASPEVIEIRVSGFGLKKLTYSALTS